MPPRKNAKRSNNRVSLARLETAVDGLDQQVKENKLDNESDHGKIFGLLETVNDKVGNVAQTVANLSGRFNGNPTATLAAETKARVAGLARWIPYIIMLIWGSLTLLIQYRNGG